MLSRGCLFGQNFGRIAATMALTLLLIAGAHAQRPRSDEVTAFQDVTAKTTETQQGTTMKVLSAICWYIPNRIMDVFDIPRLHVAVGDGNGISLRLTRLLDASWFHDDAEALGWAEDRTGILFGEARDDRHFGLLAAQQGTTTRDPTEVGLSLHLIVAGANIAVSLGEALDCVVGVIGIDLSNDDHGPTMLDYSPEPVDEVGKHPVPETPLPPAPLAPAPAPAPLSGDDATSGTQPSGPAIEPATAPVPAPEAAPAPAAAPAPVATPAPAQ